MFNFATVDHYGVRTTNQFIRPSKCQKWNLNDRLEEMYKEPHSLDASIRLIMLTVLKLGSFPNLQKNSYGLYHWQDGNNAKQLRL